MSSLVERLRTRTERKRLYTEDDSDDDLFVVKKGKPVPPPAPDASPEKSERIARDDAVCLRLGRKFLVLRCSCSSLYWYACFVVR